PRPPAPKAGALTGLRYTPNPINRFSILVLQIYSFFLYPQLCSHIFIKFFKESYLFTDVLF
ncbi:hypothetical protein, partial [Barnesiella intestinihominis]|uniref:hypothetical protein n=2 Tax=Barnesiella intestinihominis TaxID=487174 RepID=UPI003AF0D0B2